MQPGSRLGPYEILSRLDAGGMGEVWRARDTRLGREVAIKILPAEFAQDAKLKIRFEREAQTISHLAHPNICTLFDVGENYLVMELLDGESLADRLTRGPLPLTDVVRIGVQIAEALGKAHREGVVHGDLVTTMVRRSPSASFNLRSCCENARRRALQRDDTLPAPLYSFPPASPQPIFPDSVQLTPSSSLRWMSDAPRRSLRSIRNPLRIGGGGTEMPFEHSHAPRSTATTPGSVGTARCTPADTGPRTFRIEGRRPMSSRTLSAFFLLLFAFGGAAYAGVTGDLLGVVTDSTGAVVPGVTVEVSSPQLLGTRTTLTSSTGEWKITLLPPGTYRVTFSLEGMEKVINVNVGVKLDSTTRVNAAMQIDAVAESITVIAESVVIDPTRTTVQENVTSEELEFTAIGGANRSYQAMLARAPGVVGTGNPNVFGANLGQNNFMLDGVNTTDPVTHTWGSLLPYDAIQEISIQTLGRDAEYGRGIGGVINVITKSGGNEFDGALDVRYTDKGFAERGAHFDPDLQPQSDLRPAASLGGPLIRDQLWFFGSGQHPESEITNPNLFGFQPAPRTSVGWDTLLKLTGTLRGNQTLAFRFTDGRSEIENARNSSYYRPEADMMQIQESTIYNLGYDVVISPNWLAGAQIGIREAFLEGRPMSNDFTTPGVYDVTTGVRSVNHTNWQYTERNRDEVIASTMYFWEGGGSHTLKLGVNFDRSELPAYNNSTGNPPVPSMCSEAYGQPASYQCGAYYYYRSGAPYLLFVSTIIPETTHEADYAAYYVQDEWHPIPAVTAKLGFRYEKIGFSTPGRSDTPQMHRLVPRAGFAWDLRNDSSSVVHAFYGEIMDDNGLTLSAFGSTEWSVMSLFLWNAATQTYGFLSSLGGASRNMYDPQLKPTYAEEISLGFTQRLARNTSLDLTAVRRKQHDIFEDSCVDEGCTHFIMTNKPGGIDALRNEYQGLVLKLETRPTDRLHATASYTNAQSKGSVGYTQNMGAVFDVYPDHFVNTFGYLGDDARHRVKADGFVRVPRQFVLGFTYTWDSGTPWSVTASVPPTANAGTLFVEPRGSQRKPDYQQFDLQVQKNVALGAVNMSFIAAVENVFDSEIVMEVNGSIGSYAACRETDTRCLDNPLFGMIDNAPERLRITNPNFGKATSWQRPRRYDVGVRLTF
jgi:hypothetical protein